MFPVLLLFVWPTLRDFRGAEQLLSPSQNAFFFSRGNHSAVHTFPGSASSGRHRVVDRWLPGVLCVRHPEGRDGTFIRRRGWFCTMAARCWESLDCDDPRVPWMGNWGSWKSGIWDQSGLELSMFTFHKRCVIGVERKSGSCVSKHDCDICEHRSSLANPPPTPTPVFHFLCPFFFFLDKCPVFLLIFRFHMKMCLYCIQMRPIWSERLKMP